MNIAQLKMTTYKCLFNCSPCSLNNAAHYCRTCKAVNVHRNNQCDGLGPRCIFNCDYCAPGSSHICRLCNGVNLHRSADCPLAEEKKNDTVPIKKRGSSSTLTSVKKYNPLSVSKDSFIIAGIILYYEYNNAKYILVQRRSESLGGKYLFPGGSIESRVPWNDAVRELDEEAGLNLVNYEVKGHVVHGGAINFVVRLKWSGVGLPKWTNHSSAHQWESQAFPRNVGVTATHGHNWIREDVDIANRGLVGSLFKKAKKLMD